MRPSTLNESSLHPQNADTQACEICSLQDNCVAYSVIDDDDNILENASPPLAQVCPQGSGSLPQCARCAAGYYLVRPWGSLAPRVCE